MFRIMIVDDDKNTLKFVRLHLEKEGYDVIEALDGRDALKKLESHPCDIAVVDIMMPFMDGISLTKEIRKTYDVPTIILTAKDQIDDKAVGFEAGTDDYLTKPFETKELVFRIKALLRRYGKPGSDNDPLRLGNVLIFNENYSIKIDTKIIKLPLKEFELLYLLAKHPQHVFSREQIIEKIWGMDFAGDNRTVDVHIKRVRRRFSHLSVPFSIRTVRGVGYTLETDQ